VNKERVAELIKELLGEIGEDAGREGLLMTPDRVASSWEFLTQGYNQSVSSVLNDAVFESQANNMVIVRDIEIYSLCEHHMLPFFGKCHIGYIASDKVMGVSKLARIADVYARRLQIQERLTAQIADAIQECIQPEGVGVVIECKHLCMMMRGVQKQNSVMTTSSVLGSFRNDASTRNEFLRLIKSPSE
jgi:GTP cyclohydrolase I